MRNDRVSGGEIVLWGALGLGLGMVAGFALSEWLGGVNRGRLRRAARRLQERPSPARGHAAGARAAQTALDEDERLQPLRLEARPAGGGAVELHGWVPDRATRALAARVVRAVPGIERVINNLLVRGEDDRSIAPARVNDQTA